MNLNNVVELSGGTHSVLPHLQRPASPDVSSTHNTGTQDTAVCLFSDTLGEIKCTLQCKLPKLLPTKR